MISERWRRDRQFPRVCGSQNERSVIRNGRLEWRGLFPIGHELSKSPRVHHRSGKLVRTDFARFLENVNIFSRKFRLVTGGIVLRAQSREGQRAGKAASTRAQ